MGIVTSSGRAGSGRPEPAGKVGLPGLLARRLVPPAGAGRADVWIQGVSVGEVEIARTLALALRALRPGLPLLVTSTTPAGVALLGKRFRDLEPPPRLQPFPLDLAPSVGRLLSSARPRLLVLVETELWPVLLNAARRRKIPVLVASARLSERSARRLRAAGPLFRGPVSALSAVAARTDGDAARFAAIGVPEGRIRVAGDMKFDRPLPPEPVFADEVRALAAGRPVVVAGSIAEEELDLALSLPRRLAGPSGAPLLLLAPRRTEAWDEAARRAASAGLRVRRRSRPGEEGPADVYLLDTIGELASAYRLGDAALLGGTFGRRGGHNVLEPLLAGLPVVVGPSIGNIRAAVEAAGEAVAAAPDGEGAVASLARFLADPSARARARAAADALFVLHRGATERTARLALELLDAAPEPA